MINYPKDCVIAGEGHKLSFYFFYILLHILKQVKLIHELTMARDNIYVLLIL